MPTQGLAKNACVLTLNAGSSTIKIGLFALDENARDCRPEKIAHGVVELTAKDLQIKLSQIKPSPLEKNIQGEIQFIKNLTDQSRTNFDLLIKELLFHLEQIFPAQQLIAVGHRVVHGGDYYTDATLIDKACLNNLISLIPLAPLHQPLSIELIRSLQNQHPQLIQTASFDTAFHRSHQEIIRRLALPRTWFDQGIKRYGFHGLSYQYIARQLHHLPQGVKRRSIVAHLGSGASLCAMKDGISCDSTMGFSTLDGLPMATRCGNLDAGALLYCLQERNMSVAELSDTLYHRSGLLGISGISGDVRVLAASNAPEAKTALELFVFQIAKQIAALSHSIQGLDTLVFTAGIGEHNAWLRAAVCQQLNWLGIELDTDANQNHHQCISSNSSAITVYVLATDEEQIIAEQAFKVIQRSHESNY